MTGGLEIALRDLLADPPLGLEPEGSSEVTSLLVRARRRHRARRIGNLAGMSTLVLVTTFGVHVVTKSPNGHISRVISTAHGRAYPDADQGQSISDGDRVMLLREADKAAASWNGAAEEVYVVASTFSLANQVVAQSQGEPKNADKPVWVLDVVGDFKCDPCYGLSAVKTTYGAPGVTYHFAFQIMDRGGDTGVASGGLGLAPHHLDDLGRVSRLR